jgi:hypothetical protein
MACGGGGGSSTPAPSFTVAAASLTLPVPPSANVDVSQGFYPAPYSGTAALTITRNAGFTGAVTLSVNQAQLPVGVKANFANATDATGATTIVPPSSASATLSVQAGYPDPSDGTFTKQIYPALGSYSLPISASASGATGTSSGLALTLKAEAADFGLAFASFNADGTISTLNSLTNLQMLNSPMPVTFAIYWPGVGTYTAIGPVALSLLSLPPGLGVTLDTYSSTLYTGSPTDRHTMTLTASPGLAAGTYSFLLQASFLGVTHALPVVVTYSPYPFSLQAPLSSEVTLAQGGTLTFPVYLWHNDAYFGTTLPADGTDPIYLGQTALSVAGAPTGLTVRFTQSNPTGLAAVPLQVTASGVATGSYPVTLQATRVGAGGVSVPAAPLSLTVHVTNSSSPTLWIQNVEWGQTVVAPNLRLVGGKPALLRVQLLADRTGVASPPVTATIKNQSGSVLETVTLQGPATVPMTVTEGDLPKAPDTPSGSTYTAVLPASDIQPGMTVTLTAGSLTQPLAPSVDPGYTLNLTAVPITCKGVAPVLPDLAQMTRELKAFWPLKGVNLIQRAPYTTSTVIPAPNANPATDTSFDGWVQLLGELASLRIVDQSTANYYGFFNPSIPPSFSGLTTAGISMQGEGVGIGMDVATASSFQNDDPGRDLATMSMVHEEGHAFNLNHAPAGGAGNPQLNYPYSGAVTGTWGFDPATLTAYDPTTHFDIMSYAPNTHWVSDWDYLSALGFLGEKELPPVSLGTAAAAAVSAQWVISGWVRPDGQVRLAPLLKVACAPSPPTAGELKLVLSSANASRSIAFSATQLSDLPAGYRPFTFTVPASDELTAAEVWTPGGRSFQRTSSRSLPPLAQATAGAVQCSAPGLRESGTTLHLEWDAQAHPYASVLHEGKIRMTLGLNLTGGSADLSLAGVPAGGQFVVHYSDGLNAVVSTIPRPPQP